MSWFSNSEKKAKEKHRADLLKAAIASGEALGEAARGTMDLAQDVTTTLQAKIDDYANQIEHTSRILSDALLVVDQTGNIESFNPAAERVFGWKRRSIIGKSISNIFDLGAEVVIDDAYMVSFVDKVTLEDQSQVVNFEEFRGLKKDGAKLFIDVSASRLVRSNKKVSYILLVRDVTHKVNNQIMMRELAEKNQELLKTIDASNTGFMILEPKDSDFKITFVNAGLTKLTGHTRSKMTSMGLKCLLGTESGYWDVKKTLNSGLEGRHEVQLIGPKCESIWFDVHITPVVRKGDVYQWILVFYDTSELKTAYSDLRKSESHFRAFSDASSESMIIHDYEALLDWNERLLILTGYSNSELAKINPFDLLHPLEREKAMGARQFTHDASFETLFLTKQGEVKEVAVNSRAIEWENAQARIAIVRDVTAFKDVETQLKLSRERYSSVIDNTIDMIVCFDADFTITFSNQTFRTYYDVDVDDLNGACVLEIIPESDHKKFKDYMLGVNTETEIRRGVHRVLRHGEIKWQDWIDRGIFDAEGNLVEIQSVARDITHLMPSQE